MIIYLYCRSYRRDDRSRNVSSVPAITHSDYFIRDIIKKIIQNTCKADIGCIGAKFLDNRIYSCVPTVLMLVTCWFVINLFRALMRIRHIYFAFFFNLIVIFLKKLYEKDSHNELKYIILIVYCFSMVSGRQ